MIARSSFDAVVLALMCFLATVARAELRKVEVPLSNDAVATHAVLEPSGGIYYVLSVDLPASLTAVEIKSALLELYADVSSTSLDGWTNDTPVVELYPLKAEYNEDLDLSKVHGQSEAVRPVRVGEGQRVVLDVTSIIRAWAKDPELNHGMILGTFRGMKEGVFSIRSDRLAAGELARITILYDTPDEGVVE